MGCPGSVYIGDNLTFSICTHDADTGERTDASSPPAYSIYEDDTASPVLTGTMAKHNTVTGLYLKKVATTTLSAGKGYTIDISATVDTVTGGISYGFRAEDPARLLLLDWTGLTVTATRCMLNALRFLRNKWSISGTTLTVTAEDDTASAWTAVVSTDASASPVVGSDPT